MFSWIKIVDILILIIIVSYGLVGAKRGVIKQAVMTAGIILVFLLAFYFKNPLAKFLSVYLPFFEFNGLSTLNIILYQMIAFLLVFIVLLIALNILIKVSDLIEKILKYTIILSIPSKILGFIVGAIEGYIVVFIALFFLTQPTINITYVDESEVVPKILTYSFGLSNIVEKTSDTIGEISLISNKYKDTKDTNTANAEIIDIMLKNKFVDKDYITTLKNKKKLNINNLNSILDKY